MRKDLAASGWTQTHLMSPGNGVYYARTPAGGLQRYRDAAPFDGSGADLQSFPGDPVDTAGWDQALISALPFTSFPESTSDVSVFGAMSDGRLTYTTIDSATGDRTFTTTSVSTVGFTPKALAALNYNTLLVTSTGGRLHRVDVVSTNPLVFTVVDLNLGGWTHNLLSYDGDGSLFGIAGTNGTLRRYTVPSAKPTSFPDNVLIGTGFTLNAFTTTGADWILGTTTAGRLISYNVQGAGSWVPGDLAPNGWTVTQSGVAGQRALLRADGRRWPAAVQGRGAVRRQWCGSPILPERPGGHRRLGPGRHLRRAVPGLNRAPPEAVPGQPPDKKGGFVRLPLRLALLTALSGSLVLAAPTGASAQDPAMSSVVEDYAYPNAAAIEQEQGIKLIRGDGRITLSECEPQAGQPAAPDQFIVETLDRGFICFRVRGGVGYLGLEIPSVYFLRGGDEQVTATVTLAGNTEEYEVPPAQWESVTTPEGDLSVLLELRAGEPGVPPASAGTPGVDPAYNFAAKILVGDVETGRACSGSLVASQWVLTTKSCIATEGQPVVYGRPTLPITVIVGRPDLAVSTGLVTSAVRLLPHPDRDVVLVALAKPVPDVTPVPIATTAPTAGEVLRVAGFGRTATAWVPDQLHSTTVSVTGVAAGAIDIVAQADPAAATTCKGDAGGPALRESGGVFQLVAIHQASWQNGCLAVSETRQGGTEVRVDDLATWVGRRTPPGSTATRRAPRRGLRSPAPSCSSATTPAAAGRTS